MVEQIEQIDAPTAGLPVIEDYDEDGLTTARTVLKACPIRNKSLLHPST